MSNILRPFPQFSTQHIVVVQFIHSRKAGKKCMKKLYLRLYCIRKRKKIRSESHSRVKLKASTDAFKYMQMAFYSLILLKKKKSLCLLLLHAWLCILSELTIEKKQPRRRFRLHIKTMIIGVLGNYDWEAFKNTNCSLARVRGGLLGTVFLCSPEWNDHYY